MDAAANPLVTAPMPYWTALLVGLFGAVHCLGMCGGVMGALSYGVPAQLRARTRSLMPFLIAYNAGRIAGYAGLGALVGGLGAIAGDLAASYGAWAWLRAVAGLAMLGMGLYLAGVSSGVLQIEALGARLWVRLEPLRKKVLPVRSPGHAFAFGLVWAFLPCGLIYTMLIWALAAGGALEGAAFLFAFGLGTLPALLAVGLGLGQLGRLSGLRRAAGAVVATFGIWTLVASVLGQPTVGLGCLNPV